MKLSCRFAGVVAAILLLVGIALQQAAVGGFGPIPPDVLVASGGASGGWQAAPLAFATHAGAAHLATNLFLAGLFGALWLRLGARVPCRLLGAVALFACAGALALVLARAVAPAARVGASGGVYALLAALVPAVVARRTLFPDPRSRRLAVAGTLAGVVGLILIGLLQAGPIDHAAHLTGAGLGLILGTAMERWPRPAAAALASTAAIWAVLAIA